MHLRDLLREQAGAKNVNRSQLLRTIMAKPGTQVDISIRSKLSQGLISEAVSDLESQGLIRKTLSGRSNILEMEPTEGAAVGIELGFQHAAVVARRVDQSHLQAVAYHRPAGAARPGHSWLDQVVEIVRHVVSELGQQVDDIAAIGLGVPRMVAPQTGELTPPLLPPWSQEANPASMLADALAVGSWRPRVLLDNDANLAALAESLYSYPKAETLVSIKASTGIGAGIIVDHRIFRGAQGVAGEIGHMVLDPSGRFCSCGGRGCLETIIGADALVEQAKMMLGGFRQPSSPENLQALVSLASSGDLTCQRVLREAARTLGFAIGNLCNVLNPDVVVLGGALGRRGASHITLDACWEGIRQSAMAAALGRDRDGKPALRLEASGLAHAAAHGALLMALDGTGRIDLTP